MADYAKTRETGPAFLGPGGSCRARKALGAQSAFPQLEPKNHVPGNGRHCPRQAGQAGSQCGDITSVQFDRTRKVRIEGVVVPGGERQGELQLHTLEHVQRGDEVGPGVPGLLRL